MEEKIDKLLKNYLSKRESISQLGIQADCPTELELSDCIENRLSPQKQDLLLKHIADCPDCLSLLLLAQQKKEEIKDKPTPEMIRRAQDIVPKKSKKTIFNYKWSILAFLSFALSFIFRQYFLQFLVLATVFSLKWIFDTAGTRTLIMIYEAWRKKDRDSAQRIIQDLQDKIKQRKG